MKCDNCGHDNVDGARFCATCGNTLIVGDVAGQKSLIGEVVGGRYRIVGLIGEGGMGVVYKAEQKLGSAIRPVAVKTLHAELSRDPAVTARFHREVGTVAQLEHPNTVKVYDFGSTADGTLYIAMEFLDGHALAKIIASEGPLPLERVSKIVHQIAGSLEEAHRGGIIHRDLKPENVLLVGRAGERDVVKLVDFGIAARTESADRAKEQKLTQQGTVLGTPPYMSPEQFTGKALDVRSDIYSLGVMVYEMLTGELPFEANTAWEWATAHMTAQPRDFTATRAGDAVPKAVRDVVLKAMAKDPAQRQASATEFDRQLADAISRPRTAPAVDFAAATQAMAQAPPGVAVAATAAMPMPTPGSPSPVAVPPAPPRDRGRGGGSKAPIIALGSLGAVLLIAMGVLALQGSGDDTPTDPTALGALAQPPPAVITAEVPKQSVSGSETAAPEPAPAPPEEPAPKPQTPAPKPKPATTASSPPPKPATTPAAPATSPPPVPTPQPPPVTTQPPAAPPPSQPAAPTSNACAQCSNAVAASDWASAAQHYANCSNKQEKSSCSGRMAQAAPRAARAAALNQDCTKARAIAAAAQQMGVPANRFAQPLSPCK
jgi:eukaryotic-like serine/threonine-protein kinase